MKKYVVLAAGGSGTRMQANENKIFLSIGDRSVLVRSILLFDRFIDGMVIVCREEDRSRILDILPSLSVSFPIRITVGGPTRQASVLNGLRSLQAEDEDIVLIHDAARCATPRAVIEEVLDSCIRFGNGVPGIPAVNTMKTSDDGHVISGTVDRSHLYEIQTPQGFRFRMLLDAYCKAEAEEFTATDDASVVEHCDIPVRLTSGSRNNIKITEKEDLPIMEAILQTPSPAVRIGMGYDVHQLVENRKLILCGVDIPYSLGLLGHSDADVALHALMDAMLGAAALGDIGTHFPDSDKKYEGISSLVLLQEASKCVRNAGYELINADITIVAQRPKLAPHIPQMIHNISNAIQCDPLQISVKATTTEKLGFEGRGEGISAQAVCLLQKKVNPAP